MILDKLNQHRLELIAKLFNLFVACSGPLVNNLVIVGHHEHVLER